MTAIPADFDLVSPSFKVNPYPTYAWLRAEAPVYRAKLRLWGSAWLVTRYDDVVALLKDERFMKNRRRAMSKEQLRRTELPFLPGRASRAARRAGRHRYFGAASSQPAACCAERAIAVAEHGRRERIGGVAGRVLSLALYVKLDGLYH